MYVVYWSEIREDTLEPRCREFDSLSLTEVLSFMEAQRKIEREEGTIGFVAMVSKHPDSVGHPGVDVTGPDYSWKKRRV